MPYGQGQQLGASIDPRMFVQDYSGFANAGMIQGQGIANIGAQIGQLGREYGDFKKRQKEDKDKLKAGAVQIEAAAKLFPSYSPVLEDIGMQLKDENMPLSERAAIADQIGTMINMTVGESRWQAEQGMRRQEMEMRKREADQQYGLTAAAIEESNRNKTMDAKVKSAIGPALLESVLRMTPGNISANIDPSLYAPEERYNLANTLMALQPKGSNKAPAVQDIPTGDGGSMKMQWDGQSGQWIPIQTPFDISRLPNGLQPHAQEFAAAGAKYGVDPKVLAAIAMHETGNGTSNAFKNKNNAMGVSDANGPIDTGTVAASIDRMARLLAAGAKGQGPYAGKTTIEEIAKVYAPVGAGNDPNNLNKDWANGVSSNVRKLGGNPSGPIGYTPPPPTPGQLTEKDKWDIAQAEKENKDQAFTAKAKSEEFIKDIENLEKHPGFSNLFGSNIGVPTWVAGSAGADAKGIYEQISAKGFMEAIKAMKGMGALSNAEGEKASAAFLGINPSMSEAEVKRKLAQVKAYIRKGIELAVDPAVEGTSPTTQDPASDAASKLRSMLPTR